MFATYITTKLTQSQNEQMTINKYSVLHSTSVDGFWAILTGRQCWPPRTTADMMSARQVGCFDTTGQHWHTVEC